ncbi:MAG: hypothetical protein ACREQY_09905, partial [Candidatus Binatia bacterium]
GVMRAFALPARRRARLALPLFSLLSWPVAASDICAHRGDWWLYETVASRFVEPKPNPYGRGENYQIVIRVGGTKGMTHEKMEVERLRDEYYSSLPESQRKKAYFNVVYAWRCHIDSMEVLGP